MRVYDARMIGFLIGLILTGFFPYIEVVVVLVAVIGIMQVFSKRFILTGPFGGFLIGIPAGYFLRELLIPYLT